MGTIEAVNDLELAQTCARGDRAAQRAVCAQAYERARATLGRIVGPNAPLDDLVQEAVFAALRSIRTFRGDSSLATWVDRIAVRTAYAYFARRRDPRCDVEPEAIAATARPPDEAVYLTEARMRLCATLERLDSRMRIAFTLHVLDERPMAEVAEIMEATVESTKTRVHRARLALEMMAQRDPVLAAGENRTRSGVRCRVDLAIPRRSGASSTKCSSSGASGSAGARNGRR